MAEYIDREKIQYSKQTLEAWYGCQRDDYDAMVAFKDEIDKIPASDVVSRGAYDQTDWERCVALTQLKEIGKGLGERMDDVRPVVFCKDCREYDAETAWCELVGYERSSSCFCSEGEKRET